MKIYGDLISGNCHKIKLLCSLLSIGHEWIAMDIMAGDCRQADFLAKNPNGKIPLLELDNGRFLAESNAILCYLSNGTDYLPADRYLNAKILEWMFFEQYSHEPYIAVRRFINKHQGLPAARQAEYEAKFAGGEKALGIMESRLSNTDFLVGKSPTIADIALYGYTHVADEGGYDLDRYPAIQAWLGRIAALPGYESMPST